MAAATAPSAALAGPADANARRMTGRQRTARESDPTTVVL